jgi:diguanylate cyclase (GGDEF)-like protein
VFGLAVWVRLAVYTPLALGVMAISHWHGAAILGRLGPAWADWVNMGTSWLAALSMAFILMHSSSPDAHLYHAGFVVVLMYGNLLQRLRFHVAVVFSVAVAALPVLMVFSRDDYPPALKIPMLVMLLFSAGSTLAFNYALERQSRRRYLLLFQESHLLDELRAAHAERVLLSQTDALTGLANRRAMDEYLCQVWASTQAEPQAVSLLLIEVDLLRGGAASGADRRCVEACVREVAQVLGTRVRPKDLMVRFDAQTFAAILPDAENIEAMVAADRLLALVRNVPTPAGEGELTLSIGVATAVPADGVSSPESLVERAQRALARAVVAGRDQVSS